MEDEGRGPDLDVHLDVEINYHPIWSWLALLITLTFVGGIAWLIAR